MSDKSRKNNPDFFNKGLNFGLSSSEDAQIGANYSKEHRRPKRSPDLDGNGFVPDSIKQAQKRVGALGDDIERMRDVRITRELAAGATPKAWLWIIIISILTIFDGLLLGPVISNAIHSFEYTILIYCVGLGVALIIAAGGYGVGYAIRAIRPQESGKAIAALVAALLGVAVGVLIGWAGDGTLAGLFIRGALTCLSMLAAAVCHFVYIEAKEAWGAVEVARKQENELIAERDANQDAIDQYQESTIAEHEAFERSQADWREGVQAGKEARKRWVAPEYKNLVILALTLFTLACSTGPVSAEERHTTVVVIDVTDEGAREALANRTLEQISLGYGQAVEVYLLGCNGLSLAYRNTIKPINQPRHRQHLETVKAEMKKTVITEVKAAADTACSPIQTSLLMLAAELSLRRKSGEYLTLVVGSDFESNRDKAEIEGQPFAGLDVLVVLASPTGRNLEQRRLALKLIERLFAGTQITITN